MCSLVRPVAGLGNRPQHRKTRGRMTEICSILKWKRWRQQNFPPTAVAEEESVKPAWLKGQRWPPWAGESSPHASTCLPISCCGRFFSSTSFVKRFIPETNKPRPLSLLGGRGKRHLARSVAGPWQWGRGVIARANLAAPVCLGQLDGRRQCFRFAVLA